MCDHLCGMGSYWPRGGGRKRGGRDDNQAVVSWSRSTQLGSPSLFCPQNIEHVYCRGVLLHTWRLQEKEGGLAELKKKKGPRDRSRSEEPSLISAGICAQSCKAFTLEAWPRSAGLPMVFWLALQEGLRETLEEEGGGGGGNIHVCTHASSKSQGRHTYSLRLNRTQSVPGPLLLVSGGAFSARDPPQQPLCCGGATPPMSVVDKVVVGPRAPSEGEEGAAVYLLRDDRGLCRPPPIFLRPGRKAYS
jgi:hypothetical protein